MDKYGYAKSKVFLILWFFFGGGAHPTSENNFLDPLVPTHQSPCCLQSVLEIVM